MKKLLLVSAVVITLDTMGNKQSHDLLDELGFNKKIDRLIFGYLRQNYQYRIPIEVIKLCINYFGKDLIIRSKTQLKIMKDAKKSSLFNKKQNARIYLLGLNGSGKTTISNMLKYKERRIDKELNESEFHFEIENIKYKNMEMLLWDISFATWSFTLKPTASPSHKFIPPDAIIFVIDMSDKDKIDDANKYLNDTIKDLGHQIPILIFCNKSDLIKGDINESMNEITKKLDLCQSDNFEHIHICSCCAIGDQGLYQGLQWLYNSLSNLTS